jgi:hypothetical protein
MPLVNLIMSANIHQEQNIFRILCADKLKYDSTIVSRRARPETCKNPFQLMCVQTR